MQYMLGRQLISIKFSQWIIILQEFDMEFTTPKSRKSLALVEFIISFPSNTIEPPINDTLPDEHLFLINTDVPWYRDILTYLHTQKISPHLTWDDQRHISH